VTSPLPEPLRSILTDAAGITGVVAYRLDGSGERF